MADAVPVKRPEVGARVQVMGLDDRELGLGTYQGEVSFEEAIDKAPPDEAAEPVTEIEAILAAAVLAGMDLLIGRGKTTPKILLDSGRIIYGYECFWTEAEAAASSV